LKRVTVLMPPDIHKRLKLLGFDKDKTMNDLILTAVHKYLSEAAVQIEHPEWRLYKCIELLDCALSGAFFLHVQYMATTTWFSTNWAPNRGRKSFGRLNQTSLLTDAPFHKGRRRLRNSTIGHSTSTLVLIPIACSLTSLATPLTDGAATPTVTTSKTAEKSLATKNSAY